MSINRVDILFITDELNQYLQGNVTKEGLKESLQELIEKL